MLVWIQNSLLLFYIKFVYNFIWMIRKQGERRGTENLFIEFLRFSIILWVGLTDIIGTLTYVLFVPLKFQPLLNKHLNKRPRDLVCRVWCFLTVSRFSLRQLHSSPPEVGSPASSGAVPGLGLMRCIGRLTFTATKPQIDTHNHRSTPSNPKKTDQHP